MQALTITAIDHHRKGKWRKWKFLRYFPLPAKKKFNFLTEFQLSKAQIAFILDYGFPGAKNRSRKNGQSF